MRGLQDGGNCDGYAAALCVLACSYTTVASFTISVMFREKPSVESN